jgi:ubiquinone/menaquinone biosynthesis C-methylase UbiE
MAAPTVTPQQAKAFYDRFGSKQDSQAFYEDRALGVLIAHACLETAERVFELGCGTGRLARSLLERHLPPTASYYAADLSSTMVRLASNRLRPFADRSLVMQLGAGGRLPLADSSVDRLVSTYVLDLLSETEAVALLGEAHRVLTAGGRLCLVGITRGEGLVSRLVMSTWSLIHRISPALVGGCRPVEIVPLLEPRQWRIDFHGVVTSYGIASEVLVGRPRFSGAAPPSPASCSPSTRSSSPASRP